MATEHGTSSLSDCPTMPPARFRRSAISSTNYKIVHLTGIVSCSPGTSREPSCRYSKQSGTSRDRLRQLCHGGTTAPVLGCLAAGKTEIQREDGTRWIDQVAPIRCPPGCPSSRSAIAERLPGAPQALEARGLLAHRFGPLNQVIHVYPYDDLNQRTEVRAALANDPERNAMPGGQDLIVAQEAEIVIPAPFMHPLGSRDYGTGNVYEMRTYTYAPGALPKVLEAWAKAVPAREELSPLAACWTSELGGLNKFVHIWAYKTSPSATAFARIPRPRPAWPPQSGATRRSARKTSF